MQSKDIARLGNWLNSWVQSDGSIYGFHNHSVWGSNPYRLMDFTSEHTTWASPFLPGLAKALSLQMNRDGLDLLNRLLDFQTESFQENSQYKHVGYQVGETLQSGLIHNAITNISLLLTAEYGAQYLGEDMLQKIEGAVNKNLKGTMGWGGGRPCKASCCNQDYARIWSQLLLQRLYGDYSRHKELMEDIDYMIEQFHVRGLPDDECVATYRNITLEQNTIEPAEYYGLMINPLIEAYEEYGIKKYLDEAVGICRHVVRSAWIDGNGQTRLHKMYVKVDSQWQKIDDMMLISGMAMTLKGINRCAQLTKDDELAKFIEEADRTYSYYQTKRGFFIAASGWAAESDIAPCTAWQAHDFMYHMETQTALTDDYWDVFMNKSNETAVVLGDNCVWVEDNTYWAIKDYFGSGLYMVAGRKDKGKFGIDIGWIPSNRQIDPVLVFEECPAFYMTADEILIEHKTDMACLVDNITKMDYREVKKENGRSHG